MPLFPAGATKRRPRWNRETAHLKVHNAAADHSQGILGRHRENLRPLGPDAHSRDGGISDNKEDFG